MESRTETVWGFCILLAICSGTVQSACNEGAIPGHTFSSSSQSSSNPVTDVFKDSGWCAATDKPNEWVEISFPTGFGAKGFTIGSTTVDTKAHPSSVLVQYVPNGASDLQHFPLANGQPLVILLNNTGTSTMNLGTGIAVQKLRFLLQSYTGRACMKLAVTGCDIKDLCTPPCVNGGRCWAENQCVCANGFNGDSCETKPCNAAPLGIFDGRVPQKDITVSSEDPDYPKAQIGYNTSSSTSNKGWCASDNDPAPWVQVKFDEPKSISTLYFFYINGPNQLLTFMRRFELQYIAPTDSSRIFRTFADGIDSLNGTHAISVTMVPPVITDTIRIVSQEEEKKACFKLEMAGCDPSGLCQAGWCQNGGNCVGPNICKCPEGFLGNRCDQTKTDINTPVISFLSITQNILVTTTFTFSVTGSVSIKQVNSTNVLVINGANSNIKIDKGTTGAECLNNIDNCQTGFTLSLDVNFGSLVDGTYIVSSGGDIAGHKGLALYYNQQSLTYIVTTANQIWSLTVHYVPILNVWQKFEITWNTNLGIGLFLNGNLLGTHGRPEPTTATQTAGLCIGCNPGITSSVVVNMQILQIHTWTVSRTELVNAGIVVAPVVTTRRPVQTTPTTSQPTSTKKTTAGPTVATTTPKTTTPDLGYQIYNMTIIGIVNSLLITPTFNFTVHGNPQLELENGNQTALVLDCSQDQYVELTDQGIPCLQDLNSCANGFTFNLEVKFTAIELEEKTYILSSGGDEARYNGMALYLHSNLLTYGVKKGMKHWAANTNVKSIIQLNQWHKFEISWQEDKGILVLIDGFVVINEAEGTPAPYTPGDNPVLIGKSPLNNYTSCMKVRNLFTWTTQREVLVDSGIVSEGKTTVTPPKTSPTTTTTTTTTTTVATTTATPIPTFQWNLTTIPTSNVIVGPDFNLTIHGTPTSTDAGVELNGTTQYIELGSLQCLLNPFKCTQGLSVQFTIDFKFVQENTFVLTSGGQLPNGIGIAVIYRYGKYQFIVSTATHSWYATCGKNVLKPNKFHVVMLSWHTTIGLELIVDNTQIELVTQPVTHEATLVTNTTVYFGKQPTDNIKFQYVIQTVSIWYAHVDILVSAGLCTKPERPEKPTTTVKPTPKPTTKVPPTAKPTASPTTKYTGTMTTKAPQCPVGCVAITSSPSKPPVSATSKPPIKTDVPTTQKPTTQKLTTTPTPTTTPRTTPTTTERGAPNYNTVPTMTATVTGTTNQAYLACAFSRPTETGIEMTIALIINGNRVLLETVAGSAGIALFSVAQVNMNLYGVQIKCSLVANYVGSSHSTQVFESKPYVPTFTVTPAQITVTEGHSGKPVTVQSTAPPQLYCCTGCRGQCQVHVVGIFKYDRKDQRCNNNNYISQAVIESTKPPNYNKEICGFVLTVANWKNTNQILVVGTLDNRRDGTQRRELKIEVNVYNQPPTAQITISPVTHVLSTIVKVTILDNYHSTYTCKSINDPHMLTFDGAHFNNMREGQFVMFKHKELPFEVRTWYQKCSKRSHATCNCGVAVQSGDDVITVIGCNTVTSGGHHPGQGHGIGLILQQLFGSHGHAHGHHNEQEFAKTPMTIQIYKNGQLTPGTYIRRYGCGQKYEIELPTGMIVTVQQSYKPFINIWIKASSMDRDKSTGLCGNFNGRRDEWSGNKGLDRFISEHVAPNNPFFNGVGAAALVTGSTYCSCVENKGSVCSLGLGVMQCSRSRHDITNALRQQAKAPVLATHRRKRQVQGTETTATVAPDGLNLTESEMFDQCENYIMKSTVTQNCKPILTTNLTQQVENCVHDYNATESFAFATSALSDIVVDCVESANTILANNDTDADSNDTNVVIPIPDNLDDILANACVEECGDNGACQGGECECDDGFSGVTCNISSDTKPVVSIVPYLCDVSDTLDCKGAVVYGDNFVNSTKLTCHYKYIKVSEGVHVTQETGTIAAVFLGINQVMCQIPRLQSVNIRISNNGNTLSDSTSPHIVYDSRCYDCSIRNDTTYAPGCSRTDSNCEIAGQCYLSGWNKEGDACRVCNPAANDTEWSLNIEKTECTAQPLPVFVDNEDDRHKIIALAVVSAVLAAILLLLVVYIVKSRSSSKSKKEFGAYHVTSEPQLHRDEYIQNNPIYARDNEKL